MPLLLRKATIAELVLIGIVVIFLIAFIAEKTFKQYQAGMYIPCDNTVVYNYDPSSRSCIQSIVCTDNTEGTYPTCEACIQANPNAIQVCAPAGTYFINYKTYGMENNNYYATCQQINSDNENTFNLTGPNGQPLTNCCADANNPVGDGTYGGYGNNTTCTNSDGSNFDFNGFNKQYNVGIQCDVQNGFSICNSLTDNACTGLVQANLSQFPTIPTSLNNMDPASYENACQLYYTCDDSTTCRTGYYFQGMAPNGYTAGDACNCSEQQFSITPNFFTYSLSATQGIQATNPTDPNAPTFYAPTENCEPNQTCQPPPAPTCPDGMFLVQDPDTNANTCCYSPNLSVSDGTCGGASVTMNITPPSGGIINPISCVQGQGPTSSNSSQTIGFGSMQDCTNFVENTLATNGVAPTFSQLNPQIGVYCDPNNGTSFCLLDGSNADCTEYTGNKWQPSDVQQDTSAFPCVLYTDCTSTPVQSQYSLTTPPGTSWIQGNSSQCPSSPKYVCVTPAPTFDPYSTTTGFCRLATSSDTFTVSDCSQCAPQGTYCEYEKDPTLSISCGLAYASQNPNGVCIQQSNGLPGCDTSLICGVDSRYFNLNSTVDPFTCTYVSPKYYFDTTTNACAATSTSATTFKVPPPSTQTACIYNVNAFNALADCGPNDDNCIFNIGKWDDYTYTDFKNALNNTCVQKCASESDPAAFCSTSPVPNNMFNNYFNFCYKSLGSDNQYAIALSPGPFNYANNTNATCPDDSYTLTTLSAANNSDLASALWSNLDSDTVLPCAPDSCETQYANFVNSLNSVSCSTFTNS